MQRNKAASPNSIAIEFMSDTPRKVETIWIAEVEFVELDEYRQLERELAALKAKAEPRYSATLPDKVGWYWLKLNEYEHGILRHVEMYEGKLVTIPNLYPINCYTYCVWSGPIPEPKGEAK